MRCTNTPINFFLEIREYLGLGHPWGEIQHRIYQQKYTSLAFNNNKNRLGLEILIQLKKLFSLECQSHIYPYFYGEEFSRFLHQS